MSPSHPLDGDALRAWLHLSNISLGPRLLTALLAHFDNDPQRIFAATDAELDPVPGFQARHLVRLRDPLTLPTDRQIAWIEKHGVWLALRGQPEYPEPLEILPDAPPILFVRGTLLPEDTRSIGIVGSRHATPYGRATAERMSRELAEQNIAVVSGGAVGIDASAHRGAISGGGRTLAFLGCGLDVDYPRDNRHLFEQIIEHGAMISENPLGAQPEAWRFPARNRCIAAMSLGVLVIEAPRKSGALITARFALDQGHPVLAVPGNIDRPSSEGCNDLLKDGAILVTETADILQAVGLRPLTAPRVQQGVLDLRERRATLEPTPSLDEAPVKSPRTAASDSELSAVLKSLSPIRRQLMEALTQSPQHIDTISQRAGISATEAGIEMIFLELDGLVRRLPGNTYIRTLG
jgi:DNA processing protein